MKKLLLVAFLLLCITSFSQKVAQETLLGSWKTPGNKPDSLVITETTITWYYADGRTEKYDYTVVYDSRLNFTRLHTNTGKNYTINNMPGKELTLNYMGGGVHTSKYIRVK